MQYKHSVEYYTLDCGVLYSESEHMRATMAIGLEFLRRQLEGTTGRERRIVKDQIRRKTITSTDEAINLINKLLEE